MAEGHSPKGRDDFEAQLVEKAARSPEFRRALLEDPKAVVERELSARGGGRTRLPEHVKVFVHEESADTFHLVLPAAPSYPGELSDRDLSEVPGAGQPWEPAQSFTGIVAGYCKNGYG